MRVVLAIAATLAAPISAAAEEPAPAPAATAGSGAPGNTPAAEPAAPAAPAEVPAEPPGEAPRVDPAYGEHPEHDTRDFPAPKGKDVVIVSFPERSRSNITTLVALAAGGAVIGAVGLYFHVDSRSASDEIGATRFTGDVWSAEHQDTYDRAHRSAVVAGVMYGVGGGLLLASAILYMVTEPKPETMVIHPHAPSHARALVAPTNGGAIVGGAWRF